MKAFIANMVWGTKKDRDTYLQQHKNIVIPALSKVLGTAIHEESELLVAWEFLYRYVLSQVEQQLPLGDWYYVSPPQRLSLKALKEAAAPQGTYFPALYNQMKKARTKKEAVILFQEIIDQFDKKHKMAMTQEYEKLLVKPRLRKALQKSFSHFVL